MSANNEMDDMERITANLQRRPLLHPMMLGAPGDAALAMQRARQVRCHLRSRGVGADRLAVPTPAGEVAVHLRIGSALHRCTRPWPTSPLRSMPTWMPTLAAPVAAKPGPTDQTFSVA